MYASVRECQASVRGCHLDAQCLGTCGVTRVGSSPTARTTLPYY